MARINIEDSFWIEALELVERMGDRDRAIGQALRFFKLAQDRHKEGRLILEDEFKSKGFSEHLIGVFAERVEGGIQAIGARKHFGWLKDRVEAGRKGGESKRKQNEANESKPEQMEASSSCSPSCSLEENIATSAEVRIVSGEITPSASTHRQKTERFPENFESVEELLVALPGGTLARWSRLHPDREYLERELLKAFGYYTHDNPKKKPSSRQGWCRALSSWLERGWGKHAGSIKGKSPAASSADSWFARMEAEEAAKGGKSA